MVPHTSDIAPGNLRMAAAYLIGDASGSFTDDFNALYEREGQHTIGVECVPFLSVAKPTASRIASSI